MLFNTSSPFGTICRGAVCLKEIVPLGLHAGAAEPRCAVVDGVPGFVGRQPGCSCVVVWRRVWVCRTFIRSMRRTGKPQYNTDTHAMAAGGGGYAQNRVKLGDRNVQVPANTPSRKVGITIGHTSTVTRFLTYVRHSSTPPTCRFSTYVRHTSTITRCFLTLMFSAPPPLLVDTPLPLPVVS